MHIRRTLLAIVGAAILLGALAGAASAGRLSTSEQRLRGVFRSMEFGLPSVTVRCEVTVEGTFHERTAIKDLGTLMGYITRTTLGACSSGAATILTETLPWHIRYSGFEGALPEITSIIAHIVGAALRVTGGGVNCLARSTATRPGIVNLHRDPVTHAITEASMGGRITTGAECLGAEGAFRSDSGSVTVSNSSSTVSISLI
jgi:hypothetical protein